MNASSNIGNRVRLSLQTPAASLFTCSPKAARKTSSNTFSVSTFSIQQDTCTSSKSFALNGRSRKYPASCLVSLINDSAKESCPQRIVQISSQTASELL